MGLGSAVKICRSVGRVKRIAARDDGMSGSWTSPGSRVVGTLDHGQRAHCDGAWINISLLEYRGCEIGHTRRSLSPLGDGKESATWRNSRRNNVDGETEIHLPAADLRAAISAEPALAHQLVRFELKCHNRPFAGRIDEKEYCWLTGGVREGSSSDVRVRLPPKVAGDDVP
jgi:hypothetical protein